jgi:hypothetical protein
MLWQILHASGETLAFSSSDFNVATSAVNSILSASQEAMDSIGLVGLDLLTISKLLALDPQAMTAVGLVNRQLRRCGGVECQHHI